MIQFDEDKQNSRVSDLRKKEEEEATQLIAAKHGLEYIDLTPIAVETDALRLVPEVQAREAHVAGYALIDKRVKLAIKSPTDSKTLEIVDDLTRHGYSVELAMTTAASLDKAWAAYKDISFATESKAGSLEVSSSEIEEVLNRVHSIADIQHITDETLHLKKSYRISKILETMLAGAMATNASDIHVEPEEAYVRLRYRLDGVLVDITRFDIETFDLLLSRIKLLSGLKLNIKKDAQDGRFSVKIKDQQIEIRTSTLPGAYNESIVLRLLNPKSISVPIEELGIPAKLLSILEHEIGKPSGMILTTGPTGSGKTTTLYAFLKKIHSPDIKIITIEDPIEYHLPGIVQTQTNDKGYSFLDGLRSALRQDPDVIMVGEIRDNETATIAVNSAQTGHLVFSTLHTNSAAGAFPRLVDLGVNSQILPSAINISLGQRLVRKLCPTCKKETPIDTLTRTKIDKTLAEVQDKTQIPANIASIWTAVGCDACNNTGYKGRIGIYEAILIDSTIEQIIQSNPSEREIAKSALPQGILTLKQDGMIKVLQGITSIDELERVIDIEK